MYEKQGGKTMSAYLKRVLSLVLVLAMIVSCVPAVWAAEEAVRPGTSVWDMESLPEGELRDDANLIESWWSGDNASTNVSFTTAAGKGVEGSAALKITQIGDNQWNDTFKLHISSMGLTTSEWTGSGMIWMYVDGSELINNVNLEIGLDVYGDPSLAVGAPYYTVDASGNVTMLGKMSAAYNGCKFATVPVAKGFTGWLGIPSYAFGYGKLEYVSSLRFYMRNAKAGDILYIDELSLGTDPVDPVPPVDGLELVWDVNNVTPGQTLYEGDNGSYIVGTTAYGGGALQYNGGGWTNHLFAAVNGTNDWRGATKLWCYIDSTMNLGGGYNLGLGIMDGNYTKLVSGGNNGWGSATYGVQNASTGQMEVKNLGDWGWAWMDANYKGWVYFDLEQLVAKSGININWSDIRYVGIKAETAVTYYADSFYISRDVVDVTGVTLDKSVMTLTVGQTDTLMATVSPENATYPEVTWTSSNKNVATVKNGVVTAVSAGDAVITATAGDQSATCNVSVKSDVVSYTVNISASEGGSVSPSGKVSVNEGNAQTITLTPDAAYEVKSVKVNGVEVALTGNTYTIPNVSEDMTVEVVFDYLSTLIWDMNDVSIDGANLADGVGADSYLEVIAIEEAPGDVALQWYSDAWANMAWINLTENAVTDWILKDDAWLWAYVKNTGSDQIKLGLSVKDANGKNYAPNDDKNGSVRYAIENNGVMQEGTLASWGWMEYIPVGFEGWVKVKLTGADSLQTVKGDLDWKNISSIGFKGDNASSFIIDDIRADLDTTRKHASYTVVHKYGDDVLATIVITEEVAADATTVTISEAALNASFVNYVKVGSDKAAGEQIAIGGQVVVTYTYQQSMPIVWDMNELEVDGINLGAEVSTNDGAQLNVTTIEEADGDVAIQWNSANGVWCDYLYMDITGGDVVTDWVWNDNGYLWAYVKNTGSSTIKLGLTVQDAKGNNYRPTGEYYANVKCSTIVNGVETENNLNSWGWIFLDAGFEGWVKLKMQGSNSMASVMGELDWLNITHIGFKSDNGGSFIIDDIAADIDVSKKHASYTVVHKCDETVLEKEVVTVVTDVTAETITVQAGTLDAKPFLSYKKTGAQLAEGDSIAIGAETVVTYEKTENPGASAHTEVMWNADDASNNYSYDSVATLNVVDYNGGKAYQWISSDWANVVDISLDGTRANTDWTGATQLWIYLDAKGNPASGNLNLGLSVTDASGNSLKPGQGEYYANVKAYYQVDGDTAIRETKLASWGWLNSLPANFKGWVGVQLTGEYGYYTALANNGKISSFDFANIAAVGFKNELRGAQCSMIIDDFAISKVAETNNTAPYFHASTKGQHFDRMPTFMGKATTVCWNAIDDQDNAITYSIVAQPANGTATVDERGNVTFVPTALGESVLTVAATDVYGASATINVTTYVADPDVIRVAAIGDSITNGVGANSPATESYPAQLQGMLGETYHVENFGMGGIKLMTGTGYSMETMPMKYAAKQYVPDIAIIMLGSNDAWQESEEKIAADFEIELRMLIAEFVEVNPDIQILLCTTPYRSTDNNTGAIVPNEKTTNYMLPAQRLIAEEMDNVTLVDINALLTQDILGDSTYMADKTHPNAAGYTLLAQEIYDSLITLPTVPVSEITAQSLTLGDNIGMNIYIDATAEDAAAAVVKITVDGKTVTYPVNQLKKDEATGNYIAVVKVAASQMTQVAAVELVMGDKVIDSGTYSVYQYAQAILAGNNETAKALVKEMLNYGAAAQTYFDYAPENLIDDALIAGAGAQDVDVSKAPAMSVVGTADGIKYYGAALVFESKTAVRFYFTGDITGCIFQVGDEILTPVQKGGLWYVEVAGINPQALDQQITLSVNGTLSVTYSPMNYVVRMTEKGNDDLKALLKAMYNYYLAAQEYVK